MSAAPRRSPTGLVLAALLLAATPAARVPGADADGLRFRRPLAIPERTADELVAIRLDAPVFAATAEGFADLRIVDASGREVARILRRAAVVKREPVRRWSAVAAPSGRPLPGGGLEIEFTLDPKDHPRPVEGFRLQTPLHDFEQRVTVERRDGAGAWRPVVDDALLYDYSRFIDTRQTEVALPADPDRRPGGTWRITVDTATVEQQSALAELVRTLEGGKETSRAEKRLVATQPFRIDSIEAWHSEGIAAIRGADAEPRPVADFRIEEDGERRRTRIHVTTSREPTTALRLVVDDRNFARAVSVERSRVAPAGGGAAQGPGRATEPLAAGRVHRIDLRGIRQEALRIAIPESRSEHYEIAIDNGDSAPLRVTGVVAEGPAYEAVFVAAPGETYSLAYGSGGEEPVPLPRYDTAAIETALAAGQVPLAAEAGAVEEREIPTARGPSIARLLGDRWFIGIAIALLAVLLAWSLVAAARRIDSSGG